VSAGLAAWVAHVAFWILLPYGWFLDELSPRAIATFVLLWVAGWFGLPLLVPFGADIFFSWVALLDIVLVLLIFKGDVGVT
jgi:hypothetical protein